MGRPVHLEAGTRHVLTYCDACPPWRRLTGDRAAALRAAADHMQLVHDQGQLAAQLRRQADAIEGRHADTLGMTPKNTGPA